MGGIKTVGLGIECDLCGKTTTVSAAEAKFYQEYAAREDRDEHMFLGILLIPGQKQPMSLDCEYLCPKCVTALSAALGKFASLRAETKKGAAPGKKRGPKPKTEKEAAAVTVVAEEKKPEMPGADYEFDELIS